MIKVDLLGYDDYISFFDKEYIALGTDYYRALEGSRLHSADYWCNLNPISNIKLSKYIYINSYGIPFSISMAEKNIGIRPVIRIDESEINNFIKNKLGLIEDEDIIKYKDNWGVVLGEYPQEKVSGGKSLILEGEFNNHSNELKETGNQYSYSLWTNDNPSKEYEYEGEKYVRLLRETEGKSKGEWFKVSPVVWRILKKDKQYVLVSEYVLTSGQEVQSREIREDEKINLEDLDIYKYLKNILIRDIFRNTELKRYFEDNNQLNANDEKVNINELIRKSLQKDKPILLIGREIDGKSKIIQQYDNDFQIICLRNETKESLMGISISDKEKIINIKPAWLDELERKYEINPEKISIIYFDEIDKAQKDIQECLLRIINTRKVNNWNLPPNIRIVLSAENDKDINKEVIEKSEKIVIKPNAKLWLKMHKANENTQIRKILYSKINEETTEKETEMR